MDLFEPATGDNTPEFTVSEIAGTVRRLVETELGWVRVRGEVGRVVLARSGHLYFDLKDDRSTLSCMTWKGQLSGLSIRPEEGMEVVAEGKMTASGLQSKFGLNVQRLAVAGEGALMAMLERRKKALAAEGLFDEARKRALPYLPAVIGVVTSPQGAVIRDILHRLRDRFPRKVLIWPVAVQGDRCAPEVAAAIRGFNALTPGGALPRPDLVIVARGGGSIEDLWGFNEESVARAVAEGTIPLISAVGHETDTTLIDYVADRRAPTPTAAAEMAVPVRIELSAALDGQGARLARAATTAIAARRQRLGDLARVLPRPEALLAEPRQRLDRAEADLPRALRALAAAKGQRLARLEGGLSPAALRGRLRHETTRLRDTGRRHAEAPARLIRARREAFTTLARRLRPEPMAERRARASADLARLAGRLAEAWQRRSDRLRDRLAQLERLRSTLGYHATLERGFAVVRAGAEIVTEAEPASRAARLEIEFCDGRVEVAPTGPRRRPSDSAEPGDQGSLF